MKLPRNVSSAALQTSLRKMSVEELLRKLDL